MILLHGSLALLQKNPKVSMMLSMIKKCQLAMFLDLWTHHEKTFADPIHSMCNLVLQLLFKTNTFSFGCCQCSTQHFVNHWQFEKPNNNSHVSSDHFSRQIDYNQKKRNQFAVLVQSNADSNFVVVA